MERLRAPFREEWSEGSGSTCRSSPHLLRTARPSRLRATAGPHAARALAQHVTMRLADSRVITPTTRERRIAARSLLEVGAAFRLVAFHVVDTHAHALVLASREEAGAFARRAEGTLSARLRPGCPFEAARFTPVGDQSRLVNTVHYILDQARRHGIASDPFHDGSALPDLIGLRVCDGSLAACARAHLPRLDPGLLAARYLPPLNDAPASAEHLADSAAAALALPDVWSRAARVVLAKHAAVSAGFAEGLPAGEITCALDLKRRRVEQLRASEAPPPALVRAVRWQLRLRAAGGSVPSRDA